MLVSSPCVVSGSIPQRYLPGLKNNNRYALKHNSRPLTNQHKKLTKEMNTCLHVNFQRKLDNIVDRICQQILCVEATSEGPVVTLCPPFLATIKHEIIRESRIRENLDPIPFSIPALNKGTDENEPLKLSHDILFLESINPSLEQYLTNRDRAKGMYISNDGFHTQLAEMWLDECLDRTGDSGKTPYVLSLSSIPMYFLVDDNSPKFSVEMSIRLMAGNHCKPHFMRANGTEKIFSRLRVLMSWSFIGFSNPHVQSFQDIITWLEVSVSSLSTMAVFPC